MAAVNGNKNPFRPVTPERRPSQNRHSAFDTQLFALNHADSSPAQAKKALEAHLAETDRRIQETSKLGTNLVQTRVNLSNRLREVNAQGEGSQIGPELRQRLYEIEREYNEIGRQSAKAFLNPKDTANPDGSNTPFATDGKHSGSPAKFSAQANDSPSKVHVPRKQRNQASDSDHIEFAAEITTSLLGQVRHLQAVLVERDEALKTASNEKSQLEIETQGLTQRLKHLDDSEQRYKDENWNLETQLQDIQSSQREAAAKEHKLQQTLNTMNNERTVFEKELEDLKQTHGKATEEHAALRKHHESELANLRKYVNMGENEKSAMQQKMDELTAQNQELAKGLASRLREPATDPDLDDSTNVDDFSFDLSGNEHSPPPSPSKGGRHSMLESETLKSSLHHAHRMIQSLKSNIHKEKSENKDLKRMLQEAQDELQIRRMDPQDKRLKIKSQQADSRKGSKAGLGAARNSKTDVMLDDEFRNPEWEDHDGDSPSRPLNARPQSTLVDPKLVRAQSASDTYQTANETEDSFETATERDTTDNDAFQTGAESIGGDSTEELTETEAGVARNGTARRKKTAPTISTKPGDRTSVQSTASTSEEEGAAAYTPVQGQPQKFRLKINRFSRSGTPGTASSAPSQKNSPASFMNGGEGGQSLFAELEGTSDDDGTPSRSGVQTPRSIRSASRDVPSKRSSASLRRVSGTHPGVGVRPAILQNSPPVPKIPMVDVGVMTDPIELQPRQASQTQTTPGLAGAITSRIFGSTSDTPSKGASRAVSDSTTQSTPPRTIWDQQTGALRQSAETTPLSSKSGFSNNRKSVLSTASEVVDPSLKVGAGVAAPVLAFSGIKSVETEPSRPIDQPAKNVIAADTPTKATDGTSSGSGILGSVFGWRKSRSTSITQGSEDGLGQRGVEKMPSFENGRRSVNSMAFGSQPSKQVALFDQASQTVLSAEQIDRLMSVNGLMDTGDDTVYRPKGADGKPLDLKAYRRPGNAPSIRGRSAQHPPLPPDHQEAIAAAAKSSEPMGPPIAPASAYARSIRSRAGSRPQTPSQQGLPSPASKAGTTPRAGRYSTTRSQISRRSSVSSFASEIEERFNMRPDSLMGPHGMAPTTDPRMIQAITQTMMGDQMWKYTRKAGRGEMSNTRHRRFFWVHPYTRTLYWSDRDPASGNRAELKSKSVAVEAVRVVADDNPFPPGLHRKSIIVVTPGRELKFTAQTSQRHETWFNALSYLLLRVGPDGKPMDGTDLTDADVIEFNPTLGGGAGTGASRSRVSLTSFRSSNTVQRHNQNHNRVSLAPSVADPRLTTRPDSQATGSVRRRLSRSLSRSRNSRTYTGPPIPDVSTMGSVNGQHASVSSRLSGYMKQGSIRNSMRSRTSDRPASSVTGGGGPNDSAEDLRRVIEDSERQGGLENVRSCCDGRHDVGSLHSHPGHGNRFRDSRTD